ncbi:hypothetical protein DUI87_20230 [Hirundo rustica rustica]|uniref:Uncharacterized protein n=1 Tax=Hirundo rustica rustica TaxID=333673 RepID=A0A3M0K7E7_HIRRU|nr:hypothetical protein DUI87_20230 [Hirundo rustica rustica]
MTGLSGLTLKSVQEGFIAQDKDRPYLAVLAANFNIENRDWEDKDDQGFRLQQYQINLAAAALADEWILPPPPASLLVEAAALSDRPAATALGLQMNSGRWQEPLHSPDAPHATSAREPQEPAMRSQEFDNSGFPPHGPRGSAAKPRFCTGCDFVNAHILPLKSTRPPRGSVIWPKKVISNISIDLCHHLVTFYFWNEKNGISLHPPPVTSWQPGAVHPHLPAVAVVPHTDEERQEDDSMG